MVVEEIEGEAAPVHANAEDPVHIQATNHIEGFVFVVVVFGGLRIGGCHFAFAHIAPQSNAYCRTDIGVQIQRVVHVGYPRQFELERC